MNYYSSLDTTVQVWTTNHQLEPTMCVIAKQRRVLQAATRQLLNIKQKIEICMQQQVWKQSCCEFWNSTYLSSLYFRIFKKFRYQIIWIAGWKNSPDLTFLTHLVISEGWIISIYYVVSTLFFCWWSISRQVKQSCKIQVTWNHPQNKSLNHMNCDSAGPKKHILHCIKESNSNFTYIWGLDTEKGTSIWGWTKTWEMTAQKKKKNLRNDKQLIQWRLP